MNYGGGVEKKIVPKKREENIKRGGGIKLEKNPSDEVRHSLIG